MALNIFLIKALCVEKNFIIRVNCKKNRSGDLFDIWTKEKNLSVQIPKDRYITFGSD